MHWYKMLAFKFMYIILTYIIKSMTTATRYLKQAPHHSYSTTFNSQNGLPYTVFKHQYLAFISMHCLGMYICKKLVNKHTHIFTYTTLYFSFHPSINFSLFFIYYFFHYFLWSFTNAEVDTLELRNAALLNKYKSYTGKQGS